MSEQINTISINKTPSFTEIWYEGSVTVGEEYHQFWLVCPQVEDPNQREYGMAI